VGTLTFGSQLQAQITAFSRGDVNDDYRLNISDAVKILLYLFQGDTEIEGCLDAADLDDDGTIQITDGIYLLQYLFNGGPEPRWPFPYCDVDRTADDLTCVQFESCDPVRRSCGRPFDGDSVLFVIDRSGSMQDSGELAIAKHVVANAVSGLSEDVEFGIIFFDMGLKRYPADGAPLPATTETKEAALAFIEGMPGGNGGCPLPALEEALQMLNLAPGETRVIAYIGDGGGTCQGMSESEYLDNMNATITAQNTTGVMINCIGILMTGRVMQALYMEELATDNGGDYCAIQ
jgi:hypothetical protein